MKAIHQCHFRNCRRPATAFPGLRSEYGYCFAHSDKGHGVPIKVNIITENSPGYEVPQLFKYKRKPKSFWQRITNKATQWTQR